MKKLSLLKNIDGIGGGERVVGCFAVQSVSEVFPRCKNAFREKTKTKT
jgi:hypothetical protein